MRVLRQKNVYFVDLNKNIYKGFVETTIERKEGENAAVYAVKDLEIVRADILIGERLIEASYEIRDLKDVIDRYERTFDKGMWKAINIDGSMKVLIPKDIRETVFVMRITYRMADNNSAIEFYKPVSEGDKHKEVVAINRLFDSSAIFPSLITPFKNEWELVYILPSNEEAKIISPGTFKGVREEETVTLHLYSVDLAHSGHINFCAGTFDTYEVVTGDDKRAVHLPKGLDGYKECVREFCGDIENLIRYSEGFLQREYPFKTLYVVFVFNDTDKIYGRNTAFLNISNLTSTNDIEPMFILKKTSADVISSQIFYFYLSMFELVDFWISEGMKGYFYDYCVRYLLGNNEFLYTLKKDRDHVLDNDVTEYALYDTRRTLLSMTSRFFRTKSKVFFHVLEGSLSRAFMEKIANYALKRREEVREDYTYEFVRLVKDVTGKDLKPLFETYVFRPGAVRMKLSFTINRKTNRVDFTIDQSPTSVFMNGNKTINGPVTVRAYEMEGIFEHVLTLDQECSFYYHPRTKKKKKIDEEEEVMPLLWIRVDPKGEHLARVILEQPDYMFVEQLLDKNVVGQMEALENLSVKPSVQICEAFERILENTHVFYKIRIDVLYVLSRTVVGTYYGFQRLIQYFIKKYCVQTSTVVKPNDFMFIPYFIQKHLVKALSLTDPFIFRSYSGREVGSASIVCAFIINILKFNDNSLNSYSDGWYLASVIEDLSLPLSSIDYSRSHKREAAHVERYRHKGKDEISEMFKLEEANVVFDTSADGKLSDERTAGSILEDRNLEYTSLRKENGVFVEDGVHRPRGVDKIEADDDTDYVQLSIDEIERFRILDMVFPSHKNLVTKACIYALGRLSLFGKVGMNKETLIQLSKYPNYNGVRVAALEVLITLFYGDDAVVRFVFEVIMSETFTMKCAILSLMIKLSLCSKFGLKTALKRRRADLFKLLRINQESVFIRDKVCDLIYLIEDADISAEERFGSITGSYETTFSTDVYKALNKFGRDVKKGASLTIRLSNMDMLRKKLLHTEYIIRLPFRHKDTGGNDACTGLSRDDRVKDVVPKTRGAQEAVNEKGLNGSNTQKNVTYKIRIPAYFKLRLPIQQ